ncbi:hypothetical protein COR22_RS22950, partial [Vibrio parahaemolyticus]|nr:hypothetical protein [Vibrio parahaemolyticus]
MLNKMNVYNFILSFLLSLFLVLPKIGILDLTVFPLLIFLFYRGVLGKVKFKLTKHIYFLLIIIIMICIWALWSSFINHGAFYPEFLFKPFRVAVVLILLTVIFQSYSENNLTNVVLNSIVMAASINALVVLIQYTNGITGLGDPLFLKSPAFGDLDTPFRKPGITAGYPVTGMLSLFGLLTSFWLYYVNKKSFIYLVTFCLSLFGLVLGARTTLLIFLLFSPVLLFWVARLSRGHFFILIVLIASFILYVVNQYMTNDFIKGTVDVMFANIFNYINTGNALDYSSRDLVENHYRLPVAFWDLLFGNSLPPRESPVNTDVSYIRIWWSNGLIGLTLYMSHFILLTFIGLCYAKDKSTKTYFLLMITSVFIASFKGPFLFSRLSYD